MISVTPAAAEQIHNAATESGAERMALRIAAHYDDDAHEMQYGIGFDEKREQDDEFETAGVTVLVSPLSREAVSGLTIDFVEIAPGDFRFVFYRPDAQSGNTGAPRAPAGGACGGCGGCGSRNGGSGDLQQ